MESVGECPAWFHQEQAHRVPPNASRAILWLLLEIVIFCVLPGTFIEGLTTSLALHGCDAQLWPPPHGTHGGEGPPIPLPLLAHFKACCEPYGPLASETRFLSQGTESFRRKLQLQSLKTDCKFFIWGLILSGWSTLVLTAFLT